MATQHKLTYGLSRSPTRANFQMKLIGTVFFRLSMIDGIMSCT